MEFKIVAGMDEGSPRLGIGLMLEDVPMQADLLTRDELVVFYTMACGVVSVLEDQLMLKDSRFAELMRKLRHDKGIQE